jgi:hypothetical protein
LKSYFKQNLICPVFAIFKGKGYIEFGTWLGSGIRDPGSEIRDPEKISFRIPDSWDKNAPDPGSGSATLPGGESLWGILHLLRTVPPRGPITA